MGIALDEFQETKARIKAKEEREVAIIKERVVREIQPKYAEIEQMKAEELNTLSKNYMAKRNSAIEQHNAQLSALQDDFESKKKEVVEGAEKRKQDLLKATLQSETYRITQECGKAIIDLDNLISKRIEKE